ncbi:beta-ketoacyl-ACP synthase [uncultured Albimonas sp.]|uniref:beta-ketoacyl-ACP synthase n=1 Tax=uncultured Albimonas sp. TaxID=1331701 RepID=UPI0030EB88AB|tara:strand:- start:137 stop:1444 length:1308 start_codon:yes stop_codon:yes gene_type:complete
MTFPPVTLPDPRDPIVVTGLGAVSPLGVGIEATWRALMAGRSGIRANDRFDVSDYPCRIAGLVPGRDEADGLDPLDHVDGKDLRKMDLFILYGLVAASQALAQAGWAPTEGEPRSRTATIVGTGVGGVPAMTHAMDTIRARGPRRLSPFVVPSFLPNLAAGWISIRHGFSGPIGAPTTACAASAQAIADGMRLIRSGEADVALVGGADACVDPISIGGFCAARALATEFNDRPEEASRPLDQARAGFVLSEGAAALVIETLSHARARGATPLAVLAGHGGAADAYQLTAGHPDGRGPRAAMEKAMAMAGLAPGEVDYVNAHSTSTPVGDAAELAALAAALPGRGRDLAVTATKANTGHLLGAAGAIEAAITVEILRRQTIPPAANLSAPDPAARGWTLATDGPVARPIRAALSNAFGFGGVNACLAFREAASLPA